MDQRKENKVVITNTIPDTFISYLKPAPYAMSVQQLFLLVFLAWDRFGAEENWASQLFLFTESIPPSKALFTDPKKATDYYTLIQEIFQRVNADAKFLDEFFTVTFRGELYRGMVVDNIRFNRNEFQLTLKVPENARYH